MRIDIDHLTLPEPEAVLLLKDEVRRLRAAIAALADQDATLAVQGGNVIVTMDATLTDEERAAVAMAATVADAGCEEAKRLANGGVFDANWQQSADINATRAAVLRGLLERTK
jgi:hypothetical protein